MQGAHWRSSVMQAAGITLLEGYMDIYIYIYI